MKGVAMVGLIVVSGLVLLAASGPERAVAAAVLCAENESPCSAFDTYIDGTSLKGGAEAAKASRLHGFLAEVICEETAIQGEITETPGAEQARGTITSFAMAKCGGGCIVEALQLPWALHISPPEEGEVTAYFSPGPSGERPGFKLVSGCGANSGCIYKANEAQPPSETKDSLKLTLEGGAEATLKMNQGEMSSTLICGGNSGRWDSEYRLSEPAPLWVVAEAGEPTGSESPALCFIKESPCAAVNTYPAGTTIRGGVNVAGSVLKGALGVEAICEATSFEGKVTENPGGEEQAKGQITKFTLTNCNEGCKVEAVQLPWSLHVSPAIGGNGTAYFSPGPSGEKPGFKFVEKCGALNGCTFKGNETQPSNGTNNSLKLAFTGGAKPLLTMNQGQMSSSFVCGANSGRWDSEYRFSEPAPLWVAPEGEGGGFEVPTLCGAKESPCSEANTYSKGTAIEGGLGAANAWVLKGALGVELICESIAVKGELTENPGAEQVKGTIESIAFEECTGGCAVAAVQLPWSLHVSPTIGGNGTAYIGPRAGGERPGFKFVENCGALNGCVFKANETQPSNGTNNSLKLAFTGGAEAVLKMNQGQMASSFFCGGNSGRWDSEYRLSSPTPLWVV